MNTTPSNKRAHEVIESIVTLTDQRDQRSLELSLITTLREMLPKAEGWLLDLRLGHCDAENCTLKHGNLATLPLEIVKLGCELADSDGMASLPHDHSIYLVAKLRGSDRAQRHLLILVQPEWPEIDRQLIQGMLRVYQNFIDLLFSSEVDTLTGLYNRRKLESTLQSLASSHQPNRRESDHVHSHFLAIMDLDRFKRINDTYGHLIGDEVLLVLANILRGTLRSGDQIFRYGGEEFVALFQDTTLPAVEDILERIRHNVESHNFPLVGNVTISIGFAALSGQESPLETLGKADRALYFAKDNGRNQVCGFDRLIEEGRLEDSRQSGSIELF
jgi:diguanylate cyclase (GGDEF)-like protein